MGIIVVRHRPAAHRRGVKNRSWIGKAALTQVDGNMLAEIISSWTGIPLGNMVKDEIQAVLKLKDSLEARVIGHPSRTPRA